MKRWMATVYAVFCTLLMVAGFAVAFIFAWKLGTKQSLSFLAGMLASFIVAPIIHELGHLAFLTANKMECVYIKCFCFKQYIKNGKRRFGFASPFKADETQAIPKTGGNMKKRASAFTIGGLIFSGILLILLVGAALTCTLLNVTIFALWGTVPYAAYIFLLNVAPFEYASGKTDALVYRGIQKGELAETVMLSAMEIQGRLYEGKSFAEIDESLYFDLPQLCEDEPLYAVILDLRYRYYLEKNELDKAADCLNRLVQAQAYLTEIEIEKIAAELTYMHALNDDLERAEESGKLCRNFLKEDTATAKRILAAYSAAFGKAEAVAPLLAQANECLKQERILGVKRFEEVLISRIQAV
ncbi:MAG: hypothetical protein IJX09_05790 [Clostridia bacterium]|nr:hypothetical protein [Clostridia bacterium]